MNKKSIIRTPSEFYKNLRPEYFSDSEIKYQTELPKENLAFILNQITTNQKQDEFESLCRKLSEKFIAPNLIPQVGPTGGGDGKTDSETYPVSNTIAERWFIPENGWSKDEKWAFAFSAKAGWKEKAKSDIKKIVETERDYTRAYFITNQSISSKKKKETQDEFINEFKIDVVILDREWILEKVYDSHLIELIVDTLNLSDVYKKKTVTLGSNDAYRIKKLEEIEKKISNPNRYFEYDFQLVEDALEAAILSRMLEKPREEIEGKFDRAFRFCGKLDNNKQWLRLHYQRAWTYIHWYNDYVGFIDQLKCFRKLISTESSISEIELYFNLLNILRGISGHQNSILISLGIDVKKESEDFLKLLESFVTNKQKLSSSLIAKTYKSLLNLMDSVALGESPTDYLVCLSRYFEESVGYLEYPFDSFKKFVEIMGDILPNNDDYDNLIDTIAAISEKRTSEVDSGQIFLKRGAQKLSAKYYKESVVYFGKAVLKLAKEETEEGLYLSLMGLSEAYTSLGLLWASYNCLVSGASISIKLWYRKGIVNQRTSNSIRKIAINELFIGRIPTFLTWWELYQIISKQVDAEEKPEDISSYELIDGSLAVRLITTQFDDVNSLSYLPDLFERQKLWLSQDAALYLLGYSDMLINNHSSTGFVTEKDLDDFYQKVSTQPFTEQMLYKTNLLSGNESKLSAKILGCEFNFNFKKDKELLFAAETILAFLEGFLATSLKDIFPTSETITVNLIRNEDIEYIKFTSKKSSSEFDLEINKFSFITPEGKENIQTKMMEFTANVIMKNFVLENYKQYFETIFKKESINERLSLIFEHRNFLISIRGDVSNLFFSDWIEGKSIKQYQMKRDTPVSFSVQNKKEKSAEQDIDFSQEESGHNKRKVFSVIDNYLWDEAKWVGFGFFSTSTNFGIFLAFENEIAGKQIFDNWIEKYGQVDKNEEIKITIIKGIDRTNLSSYRVNISSNIDMKSQSEKQLFTFASRFHEMTPENSINLDNLVNGFNYFKKYQLCPAKFTVANRPEPFFAKSIVKTKLFVKNAWEIGMDDLDFIAIKKGDQPYIPDNVQNAPVLEVLKRKKEI